MEYQIPFVEQEVSTDDPSGSLVNIGESVLGVGTLFGVTAVASYAYSRIEAGAGVENQTELPLM